MIPPTTTISVDRLEVGDRFLWCDREVTITDIHRADMVRRYEVLRGSRLLRVDPDDLYLHYFDDESVVVCLPGWRWITTSTVALSDGRDTGEKP